MYPLRIVAPLVVEQYPWPMRKMQHTKICSSWCICVFQYHGYMHKNLSWSYNSPNLCES